MPMSFLGAHHQDVVGVDAEQIMHFLLPLFRLGARQIDLVEDRDDLESRIEREEQIGECLRLNSLRCVDDENRALACSERARDLVREINVARRVDEVELVGTAVACLVGHAHRVELDGDAALSFEIERVEHLLFHLSLLEHAGGFDQPVGERGFAVIYVSNDTKIADVIEVH